ncbi:MAG: hypothetical protein PF637_07605 [Spirochaetes bacterium]|jgi:hypothetical protein|nr:hypothetical protein [Spirochaetota bacterium]
MHKDNGGEACILRSFSKAGKFFDMIGQNRQTYSQKAINLACRPGVIRGGDANE